MKVEARVKDEELVDQLLVIVLTRKGFKFGNTIATFDVPEYPITSFRVDHEKVTIYEQEIPDAK